MRAFCVPGAESVPLAAARLCADCERIYNERAEHCPHCGSKHGHNLFNLLNWSKVTAHNAVRAR